MTQQDREQTLDQLKANFTMTKEQYEVFKKLCDEFDLMLVPETEKETISGKK